MAHSSRTWRCSVVALAALALAGCARPQAPAATSAPAVPTGAPAPAATAAPAAPAATAAAPAPGSTAAPADITPAVAYGRSLALQDPPLQGDDVRAVQLRLRDLGYRQVGEVDGAYGPLTEGAVRAFQQLNGLEVDGVVGPQTWERLFGPAATPGAAVVPIVESDTGWLLGGTSGGLWLDDAATAAMLSGGEPYRLVGPAGPAGASTGARPVPLDPGPCADTYVVALSPAPTISGTLALGGSWNPLPRAPRDASADAGSYGPAVAGLLAANGVPGSPIAIKRVLRVDLEGDGAEEALVEATFYAGGVDYPQPKVEAGDYSLVAIVRDGSAQPELVVGEFYAAPQEFAAPNIYKLLAALDLNGDGSLELVVGSAYYEGAATAAYDVAAGPPREVLITGCGL